MWTGLSLKAPEIRLHLAAYEIGQKNFRIRNFETHKTIIWNDPLTQLSWITETNSCSILRNIWILKKKKVNTGETQLTNTDWGNDTFYFFLKIFTPLCINCLFHFNIYFMCLFETRFTVFLITLHTGLPFLLSSLPFSFPISLIYSWNTNTLRINTTYPPASTTWYYVWIL